MREGGALCRGCFDPTMEGAAAAALASLPVRSDLPGRTAQACPERGHVQLPSGTPAADAATDAAAECAARADLVLRGKSLGRCNRRATRSCTWRARGRASVSTRCDNQLILPIRVQELASADPEKSTATHGAARSLSTALNATAGRPPQQAPPVPRSSQQSAGGGRHRRSSSSSSIDSYYYPGEHPRQSWWQQGCRNGRKGASWWYSPT